MATFLTLKTNLCNEFHVSDATSLASAGQCINYWYEYIHNSGTFNEIKDIATVSYPAGSTSVTLGSTVQLVTAAAWNGNKITEISYERVVEENASDLTNTGTPVNFINLSKDSSQNARIRLVPLPSETKDMTIVFKKKFVPLSADSDVPLINGIDETIASYARVSFLKGDYQYAKAAQEKGEANQSLMKMVDLENNQQQKNVQFVPDYYDGVYGQCNYQKFPSKSRIYG